MMYANWTERNAEDAGISIKVAVYPEGEEPEVSQVSAATTRAATVKFSNLVMEKITANGGRVPEEALRELIENLIHAEFKGVVISVLEGGNVVRVSDKGPGIEHKERAFEFGFSGASSEALREIRGVGAGLGIARAATAKAGGTVTADDNIGGGTVVTISMLDSQQISGVSEPVGKPVGKPAARIKYPDAVPKMDISERQQKALITVLECGEVGPSTVAERLEISVSTAYRDLSALEEHGLVVAAESGKRMVTPLGRDLIEAIVDTWVK
jgi:DNA-binding transcriptional ArsR family regulator/anti-sigma regulatory factor (Ser/Thr protein kinase)